MTAVLTFNADGTGHGLYTEMIDLAQVGSLTMTRASNIEFNQFTQRWEVQEPGGAILYTHESRSVCLQWEHDHFNH